MRFFTDDPRTTTVQWYFCPEGTPIYNGDCAFRTSLYDDGCDEINPSPLGEVALSRKWRNGSKVGGDTLAPPCGSASQWANGDLLPPKDPVILDANGTPICCGGSEAIPKCSSCPCGVFTTYTLYAVGAAPDNILFGSDGEWEMEYVANCTWRSVTFPLENWPLGPKFGRWQFVIRPNQVVVGIVAESFHIFYESQFPWDCQNCLGYNEGTQPPEGLGFTLIEVLNKLVPSNPDYLTGIPTINLCPENEEG